jgi:hypothetical protein
MIFHRSQITVHPSDCEPGSYATQFGDGDGSEPDLSQCSEAIVTEALVSGHLTADQALWLHDHKINWQINIKR